MGSVGLIRLATALLPLALAMSCGGGDGQKGAAPAAASGTGAGAGKPPCPHTGLWSPCVVTERLASAGLAPRDTSPGADAPALAVRPLALMLNRAELDLYIYADKGARERDMVHLDSTSYVSADAALSMKQEPTLIASANLLAILHSRNDHQRERVNDALTAGPPQPARP